MVRTLKPRTSADQGRLILPGSTTAEPWELWSVGANAACLETRQNLQDLSRTSSATLALPATQVIALSLWLPETRSEEFSSMIGLEIEAQGLQPRNREAVFNWSVVAQEEKRTLVLVGVLAALLPGDLESAQATTFDLSVRCWDLAADTITFWVEQDQLVLAITRGAGLAFYQALSEPTFTPRVLQDITCILGALRMQGVIGLPHQTIVWIDRSLAGIEQLAPIVGTSVQQEARPHPRLPNQSWQLTPFQVGAAKRKHGARRSRNRLLSLLGIIALGVLLAFAVRLFLVSREVTQLKQWQSAHAADLAMVQNTAAAWNDLQPVVDTSSYPLEVLLHVSQALPEEQVHLTLFELDGNHLLMRAEAKNLTAGFDFFDRLKKNPQLAGYTWEMAQPHLLGNDITQLQIEGTYARRN